MTDNDLPEVEQAPGKAELEKLKDEYRRKNKALDAQRESLEEEAREYGYSQEQVDERSRWIEDGGREILDEVQQRIDAHCRRYGLLTDGSFSGTWAAEE
ncbi:hypothetical protein Q5762_13865 [Streptomyces sp. P9(2023)]|uniref:hypothetical protein n=1 Tax=Streptomyces sp. P9(2023) TaxID=3064394 RepID=UPI0028F438CA|nr:hypothetical protein [Streptomyces sp. P9(2023)]MDT9689403.1 hypothetical protein [Streptomyces sp. P9(2023)]